MKTAIVFLISIYTILAQPKHQAELIITVINHGITWNLTFTMDAVSARWDENNNLTTGYGSVSDNVGGLTEQAFFNHIKTGGDDPEFAAGLYKISAIENGYTRAYCYIDWRTADVSANGSPDIYIKYDLNNRQFKDNNETQVINKTYQTFWDLIPGSSLETSDLQIYWSNALAVTHDISNHPRLVWGPYPENIGVTNYRIYRKYGGDQWGLYATVPCTLYQYTDPNVTIEDFIGGTSVYYYIKALYYEGSYIETETSNTVSVNTGDSNQKIGVAQSEDISFKLFQNYPNPFNSSTTIQWQMPSEEFVSLKVFNVIGQQVAMLVNGYNQAGEHSVLFDSKDLTSGIYIYKIQIGRYESIRKLILQK